MQRGRSHLEVAREAILGGATVIQLREKNLTTRAMLEEALELRKLTRELNTLFIVNDRLDVALAASSDGVHLGEEDLPVDVARRLASNLIIGSSCDTVERARELERLGADYLGVGTVFPTATKKDAGEPIGLSRLKEIKQAVSIPVVAIGGINLSNLDAVLSTGVDGVAVVSAIVGADSVFEATSAFRKKIDSWRKK
ncbi:MAG: thiamine phosphate synthase [Candidatus Atribacteria bacterium]|nr:thiamine phosphate synthase [Candidatus Atribacteria bacterium]MCD6349301.1 thiamine phosphate synthase [Candidatus Atribacteria bacterium]